LPYTYKIGLHSLYRDGNLVTQDGYSGFPPHKNDAKACSIQNVGPLPFGGYTIRDFCDHPMLGVLAAYLDPSVGNSMMGRGGFYIHGDSSAHPGESSHGCIVLPHDVRLMMSECPDRWLTVLP